MSHNDEDAIDVCYVSDSVKRMVHQFSLSCWSVRARITNKQTIKHTVIMPSDGMNKYTMKIDCIG